MKIKFKLFGRYFGIKFFSRRWKEKILGYSNVTLNGYILVFDVDFFDKVKLIKLKEKIKEIQNKMHLSDFYFFQSSETHIHLVCFDVVSIGEFVDCFFFLKDFVDERHLRIPFSSGKYQWVLRVSEKKGNKIKYYGRVRSKYNERKKSNAHICLIKDIFKIDVNEKNKDNNNKLILVQYGV